MAYKIISPTLFRTDIPLPKKEEKRLTQIQRYRIAELQPGDSVLCVGATQHQIANLVLRWRKRNNQLDKKFMVLSLDEGVRVWRES